MVDRNNNIVRVNVIDDGLTDVDGQSLDLNNLRIMPVARHRIDSDNSSSFLQAYTVSQSLEGDDL